MRRQVIPFALAVLAIAGCAAPDTAQAPAATAEVDIATFRFAPDDTTVQAGTTVTWINRDRTRHTVSAGTADAPRPDFDREVGDVGDGVAVTFEDPGTYAYFCVLHPFMTGVIEVVEVSE
jgi:plastocyanin